ncbi:hypothetical protein IT570_08180 [Candidatus Sumerlaeota bacterium]|nr:hypothetical protein [Candidatus Sumerlaeota bacterium]
MTFLSSLLLAPAFILSSQTACADVLLTTKGQRLESIRVRTFGVGEEDDEYHEFDIETVVDGKLTGDHKMLDADEVQSIEFRELDDPPTTLGRVAHVQGHTGGPKNHVIVERADRTPDGLVFRVRKASEPYGVKTKHAKGEDVYMMTFAPSMMETAVSTSRSEEADAPAKQTPSRGPFPVMAYIMTWIVCAMAVAGAVFVTFRRKAS